MLNDYIRAGDRVQFRINPKDDYYKQPGDPANNMTGVCVRRERITNYEDRAGLVVRKPGVYELNGPAIVKWDDGTVTEPNGWLLHMLDTEEEQQRRAQRRSELTDDNWAEVDAKWDERVFLRDLPETKAWEGDFIRLSTERHGIEYGVIASVDYYMMEREGESEGRYSFRICDENKNEIGGTTYTRDSEFEVLERGNVYKYFNNEQVVFKDLREEANFFQYIGHAKEVRNPVTKKYSWTLDEALLAIRDDVADSISVSHGLFGGSARTVMYRFKDRELGKRLQAETLAGFKNHK